MGYFRENKRRKRYDEELGECSALASRLCQIPINKVVLALLAGSHMFENRLTGFMPNMIAPAFSTGVFPPAQGSEAANQSPMAVQIADIYQAAVHRAIEEHEIDKLFNPDFDDFQI
jgi:hypothetical protein